MLLSIGLSSKPFTNQHCTEVPPSFAPSPKMCHKRDTIQIVCQATFQCGTFPSSQRQAKVISFYPLTLTWTNPFWQQNRTTGTTTGTMIQLSSLSWTVALCAVVLLVAIQLIVNPNQSNSVGASICIPADQTRRTRFGNPRLRLMLPLPCFWTAKYPWNVQWSRCKRSPIHSTAWWCRRRCMVGYWLVNAPQSCTNPHHSTLRCC